MSESVHSWINCREIGNNSAGWARKRQKYLATDALSQRNALWKRLYRKYEEIGCDSYVGYSGVFGIKYSPDGKLVVAACEKDAVVMVDPLTSEIVQKRENVHTKRCNTVTFIDNRLFATCSDDSSVALWDIRNMKEEVLHLKGHKGWVKNIEYHKPTQQLISAGFDNQVIAWDINNPLKNGDCSSKMLLKCENLMRMRLSDDGRSMYISTIQTADLIAIHNLDINSMPYDIGKISSSESSEGRILCYHKDMLPVNRNDQHFAQAEPMLGRNHVEVYYGYCEDESQSDTDTVVFCQSIDVHPQNMAIVMRYDTLPNYDSKFLSVHNTWSYYNGHLQGNNAWLPSFETEGYLGPTRWQAEPYLPMPRGQATNSMVIDGPRNVEYLQEVSFSACGRLIASPCGYGIKLVAFDSCLSDYRTHISTRIADTHQWEEGTDTVYPAHALVGSEDLHVVTYCFGHRSIVLSTCFSPTHMQIATGSKDGQIILYQVVL